MSIQAHFVTQTGKPALSSDNSIDSCCWGSIASLGRTFIKEGGLKDFGGIKLKLDENTSYRKQYETTTERRKLVDQIFTELRFDEWLEGLITKKYSKDKTVSSITFSPGCSIPLMVTASSVYRLSANCAYFVPIYNTARKLGIRPMLSYFLAGGVQIIYNEVHTGAARKPTFSTSKGMKEAIDINPKLIVRESSHSGHMPWDTGAMSVKVIRHLESLTAEHLQQKWASMGSDLEGSNALSYYGRTKQFTPGSNAVRRAFQSELKLKSNWKINKTNRQDMYIYEGHRPSEYPREYVLNDILQAALKLQETKL